ncbi:hypothetical protein T484DRAFT_1814839 [Baffinella frigidus]|nr:hypothetical protein T484DRAFT_1814839 [Cryptophyta sp. CCMP2293]
MCEVKRVKIADEQTTFWRYHAHSETCLSTAECIFHLRTVVVEGSYSGQFDKLLFFYAHLYRAIQLCASHTTFIG